MNRQERITGIQNKINEFYKNNLCTESERQLLSEIFDEVEILRQPISLAEFLGWEETEIYQKDDNKYKVTDNKLYRTSLEFKNWRLMFDITTITNLQTATKVESKFYLQLPILDKCESYLNYDKYKNNILFADNQNNKFFQTIFTEDEVKKLEEKYSTDLSYLKRIPVKY